MTTQNEIQELAEQHGIKYLRDEYDDPLIRRISLDKIHVNSFKIKPKINCRNLDPRRLKTIERTLKTKGQGFGVIWGVEDSQEMYGIVDGNHLQNRARKFGRSHMKIIVFDVDVSYPEGTWNLYSFSYELNKGGMYIVEKIASAYYGYWYHKNRGERWQDLLPTEFGEPEQTLKRYIGLHKKVLKIRNFNKASYYKLVKSSKNHNWNETEFRKRVNACLKTQIEESESVFDDGEDTNNTDGLVFKIINYIKNVDKKVTMISEDERTLVSGINNDFERISAELDSLIILQKENDLPLKSTKHKLNTAKAGLRSSFKEYESEFSHIRESVELGRVVSRKLEKFNYEMKNR